MALWGLSVMMACALEVSDPALDGPFQWHGLTVSIPGTEGANVGTDVYYPGNADGLDAAAGTCPVIVLGHGFLQSKSNHARQGEHLATRGYVVLIPNSNEASNHSRYADDFIKCIDWLGEQAVKPTSVFHQRVRLDRVGVSGHSAGGLSAILAASRDLRIRAVSVMDPVDNGGLGAAALPTLFAPVAISRSEASSCNANGSAFILYNAAVAPKRDIRIVGANHTDPQDPANFLSVLTCGAANSTRQMLYRRYMTGWFEYHLRDDARYGPWIQNQSGGGLAQDLQQGRIAVSENAAYLEAWRFVHFGPDVMNPALSRDAADPDGDGRTNLQEYAINSNPLTPEMGTLPAAEIVESTGESHMAIRFPLVTAATEIIYQVETSGDLSEWSAGSSYSGTEGTPVTDATTEVSRSGTGLETITVRANQAIDQGRGFLRLRISRK